LKYLQIPFTQPTEPTLEYAFNGTHAFEWRSKHACPSGSPDPDPPAPPPSPDPGSDAPGTSDPTPDGDKTDEEDDEKLPAGGDNEENDSRGEDDGASPTEKNKISNKGYGLVAFFLLW
jgi:hypothetical protein